MKLCDSTRTPQNLLSNSSVKLKPRLCGAFFVLVNSFKPLIRQRRIVVTCRLHFKDSIDEFKSFIERKHLPIEKNEKGFETIASLYHKTTIKVPIQYHENEKFSFQKTKQILNENVLIQLELHKTY